MIVSVCIGDLPRRNSRPQCVGRAGVAECRREEPMIETQYISEGIADSAEITGGTDPHADDNERMQTQPKPDVSDQDWQELVPKLLGLFNNNREQLARALGLHRSTVDRWLNGKSKPNTSTILRMRRLSQERRIE